MSRLSVGETCRLGEERFLPERGKMDQFNIRTRDPESIRSLVESFLTMLGQPKVVRDLLSSHSVSAYQSTGTRKGPLGTYVDIDLLAGVPVEFAHLAMPLTRDLEDLHHSSPAESDIGPITLWRQGGLVYGISVAHERDNPSAQRLIHLSQITTNQ